MSRNRPIAAIIQARMSSTRLPNKVMREVCSRPILWHVINRLKPSAFLDDVIVATSLGPGDDIIENRCTEWGVKTYRGSLDDVLDRYFHAASHFNVATIVRITADCPLIDPWVVDTVIEKYLEGGYDHVALSAEYPDGLDTEVFSFEALKRAHTEALLGSEREHVTPYIWKNAQEFRLGQVNSKRDLSEMRWTVDDESDFRFVTAIYEAFECTERVFAMNEILEVLAETPEFIKINSGTIRNEGYLKSLDEDKAGPGGTGREGVEGG